MDPGTYWQSRSHAQGHLQNFPEWLLCTGQPGPPLTSLAGLGVCPGSLRTNHPRCWTHRCLQSIWHDWSLYCTDGKLRPRPGRDLPRAGWVSGHDAGRCQGREFSGGERECGQRLSGGRPPQDRRGSQLAARAGGLLGRPMAGRGGQG